MTQKKNVGMIGALAAVVLLVMNGYGAVIKGVVQDSATSAALSGVAVQVKGTSTTTTTDAAGKFSLTFTLGIHDQGGGTFAHTGIFFDPIERRVTWRAHYGMEIHFYTVNGELRGFQQSGAGTGSYSFPPCQDGMYVLESVLDGTAVMHKVVLAEKMMAPGKPTTVGTTREKEAAAATLVLSRQGYGIKEAGVTTGDTNVVIRFRAFPNAGNTGYPAGMNLIATTGRTIIANNAVIKNEKITGGLVLNGQNDTVRNCWITSYFAKAEAANGTGVVTVHGSAVIENCLLDGQLGTHAGLWYQGTSVIIRNCNIYNVNDGIFAWDADNFTLEDNYLHDFTTETGNGHIDGFQTEGASHGVIRHNNFDITQSQNACVAIWNGRRNSDDILVDNNYMAGSGFLVYAEDYSPSEASPAGGYSVTNIRFTNNVFSTIHYKCAGYWGVWYPRGNPTDQWNRTGNVVLETGLNVDNGNPPGCN